MQNEISYEEFEKQVKKMITNYFGEDSRKEILYDFLIETGHADLIGEIWETLQEE